MTGIVQVTAAAGNEEAASALAEAAVRRRLAASAQVGGPVKSAFWHLGEFGTGLEWTATLMTTREGYPELEAFLRANHPWNNPQITAIAVVVASADYVAWVRQAVSR
ncbi:divalent-cation tolerance protein CutA [Krasilnikovia sp. M28-CT-15]|uniref:divalent-cation tolerance protein CutA n=1 Tax=Krasilnikovia sp. M28-CT-15 TaxID=3373540 RepID=UPI0038760845